MKTSRWLIFIAVIAAVALLASSQLKRGASEVTHQSDANEPSVVPAANGLRVGANAIYVPEQPPDAEVNIGFVVLATPGFVVIHEDAGDKAGEIIGVSAFLAAGESRDVAPLSLSRSSRDNEELYAMLHRDDGDHTFDAGKDLPVKDESGDVIFMLFLVTAGAEPGGEVSL